MGVVLWSGATLWEAWGPGDKPNSPKGAVVALHGPGLSAPQPVVAERPVAIVPVPATHPAPETVAVGLLDPDLAGAGPARPLDRTVPLEPGFRLASPPVAAVSAGPATAMVEPPPSPRVVATESAPADAVRKPADTRSASLSDAVRPSVPPASRRIRTAAATPAPADNRNFLQRLLGLQPDPQPALAYAPAQDDPVDGRNKGGRLTGTLPSAGGAEYTAIYDITSRTVTMPNGERLEAHSGLGDRLDDPRYVHERMKGPTPPHVYDLTLREKPFHGVRALRLNPVGGSAAIHGRDGLLAHTFMLGPNGDSNGCVSFRNYDRFLQAYLKGEVKRLVVVARMS